MKRFTLMFAAAFVLGCGSAFAQGIGAPAGPDPFRITFDENGNGVYAQFNTATGGYGPDVSSPGFLTPAPTATGFALTYALPETIGPGDVGINEPGGGLSDGLRFFNAGGAGFMQYFSDFEGTPGPDLAD